MSRGIFEQIRDAETVEVGTLLSKKDLEEFFKQAYSAEKKIKKKIEATAKENREHLEKRAKELGKPIPLILAYYTNPHFNPELLVSSQIYKEYEEWFK